MTMNKYNLILLLCLFNLTISISNISFMLSNYLCNKLNIYIFEYYSYMYGGIVKLNIQFTLVILIDTVIIYGIYKIIEIFMKLELSESDI